LGISISVIGQPIVGTLGLIVLTIAIVSVPSSAVVIAGFAVAVSMVTAMT
jgi:hypothetical protein